MSATTSSLPLVVQLGFAGSRHLLDLDVHSEINEREFTAEIEKFLIERLARLHTDLGLQPYHFFCGISQLAIGADTVFTRACQAAQIPQRILLPENRDAYLAGVGSDGLPDFPESDRPITRELFASPHIIHERVVTDALDRHSRFEDVNIEVARISDVLVCLVRAAAAGRPGGTHDIIARAIARSKPVLVITVDVDEGRPKFTETWLWNKLEGPSPGVLGRFAPPTMPSGFAVSALPSANQAGLPTSAVVYLETLKKYSRDKAKKWKFVFGGAAAFIIGTHVLATVSAAVALVLQLPDLMPILLIAELVLLAMGFSVHQIINRYRAPHVWALSRLAAELAYSVLAIGKLHVYLAYLFHLPFPEDLRPLLRTINVLHLYETRSAPRSSWQSLRGEYLQTRLKGPRGQLGFYSLKARAARRDLRLAHRIFFACSAAAFLATLIKLMLHDGHTLVVHNPSISILGALAVVLPVLAVAAVSLVAALDREARYHTFGEMHKFLDLQARRIENAQSEREFATLVLETESRLLGETANWYSRRSYTGVA